MSPPPLLLEASDLRCERDGRCLFAGLAVRLGAGEVLHVSGPNGSGKTSLLRQLAGLLPAEGARIVRPAADDILWLGHAPGVAAGLTVWENLAVLAALGRPVRAPALHAALAAVGLAQEAQTLVAALSAGQRRRVALARLYLPQVPRLWLLDEPFTALDALAGTQLENRLAAHCQAGGAVVVSSHQAFQTPAGARQLCLAVAT